MVGKLVTSPLFVGSSVASLTGTVSLVDTSGSVDSPSAAGLFVVGSLVENVLSKSVDDSTVSLTSVIGLSAV